MNAFKIACSRILRTAGALHVSFFPNSAPTYLLSRLGACCAAAIVLSLAACSPTQMRYDQASPIDKSKLKFSVSQQQGYDNKVFLLSQTPGVIPYWNYGVGTSTNVADTVILPFGGPHTIKYSVSSAGGFVTGDSVNIQVSQNDPVYFSDPRWNMLTNGETGKTWVLDMTQPIGWYGLDYLKHNGSADDWNWHPTYVGNEWVMNNVNWGQMTFDLNGDFHYNVTQNDGTGANPQNCSCGFVLNLAAGTIKLSACRMLFGGDYLNNCSNWSTLTILDLSATSMTLGVVRDNPTAGGLCWIGFTFVPKP